jgi:phosphoheptose isomerase
MRSSSEILKSAIAEAGQTLQSLTSLDAQLGRAADMITQCLLAGNKLLVCGNGGSAADAADFCTEFACRFVDRRRAYPAIDLSQHGSLLTATGNDFGFNKIFARQVGAFGKPDDVLIALSTSGQSENIQLALDKAKTKKLKTIALLGRDGGTAAGKADIDIIVPGNSTARIQEAHKFLLHVLCEIVEPRLPAPTKEP